MRYTLNTSGFVGNVTWTRLQWKATDDVKEHIFKVTLHEQEGPQDFG